MSVEKYTCYQCKTLFELPAPPSGVDQQGAVCPVCKTMCELPASYSGEGRQGAVCPACGSTDIKRVPSWIPEGFNLELYFGQPEWEYKCHQCTGVFKLPVPSGPTEEKQRKCPACGSMDIERLTALVVEPAPYCG